MKILMIADRLDKTLHEVEEGNIIQYINNLNFDNIKEIWFQDKFKIGVISTVYREKWVVFINEKNNLFFVSSKPTINQFIYIPQYDVYVSNEKTIVTENLKSVLIFLVTDLSKIKLSKSPTSSLIKQRRKYIFADSILLSSTEEFVSQFNLLKSGSKNHLIIEANGEYMGIYTVLEDKNIYVIKVFSAQMTKHNLDVYIYTDQNLYGETVTLKSNPYIKVNKRYATEENTALNALLDFVYGISFSLDINFSSSDLIK
jgi:hypothetical protein